MTPGQFADALIAYCAWSRASVTSGFRTPQRNAAVGGHPRSAHLVGLAADVVYDVGRPSAEDAAAHAQRLGLALVREDDHDHLQAPR